MEFDEDFIKKIFEIINANFDISIEPKASEKKIEKNLLKWFEDNPVRSTSSVNEFLSIMDPLFQVTVKENGRDKILKLAMQNEQEFRQGLRKNKEFFNSLVKRLSKEKEKHIKKDIMPDQEELLNISEIHTIKQILESMKTVSEISNKFLLDRSKKRYTGKFVQLLFDFYDAIALISIRWMEIYIRKESNKLNFILEMLEWDMNTLYGAIYEIRNMARRFEEESKEEKEKSQQFAKIIASMME